MTAASIQELPFLFRFLADYWWETADMVYGDGGAKGIAKATKTYIDDWSSAEVEGLFEDLWRLQETPYAPMTPDWKSPSFKAFWKADGIHRVLTRVHVNAMLAQLAEAKAS